MKECQVSPVAAQCCNGVEDAGRWCKLGPPGSRECVVQVDEARIPAAVAGLEAGPHGQSFKGQEIVHSGSQSQVQPGGFQSSL